MPLSDFLLNLAGKAEDIELRTTVQARLALQAALTGLFGGEALTALTTGGRQGLFTDTTAIAGHVLELIEKTESPIGKVIFENLIAGPMGVNLAAVAPENRAGVETIQRIIGFATELSLGTAAVAGALEPLLGSHALRGLLESVRRVPDEIGLNYFMGTVMANVFETSTGTPLREAISQQVRPARMEWPQIARLLRMHEIDPATATDRLQKAGFRDIDIGLLIKLDRQLISVADLQVLHDTGFWDASTIRGYLGQLGFEPADVDAVMSIFAHRAGAEGATSLRTVARNEFIAGTLSEDGYRTYLKRAETPTEAIELLVAGATAERAAGHSHLSVAEIKTLYQHGQIDQSEAVARLHNIGWNDADIGDIFLVWDDEKKVARSGISQSKIIAYLKGRVLTKDQALAMLIKGGMNPTDAQFLVDNPSTKVGAKVYPLTPATIYAAFKDGVLTTDETIKLLINLGVDPQAIDLRIQTLTATKSKGSKPKQAVKSLTEAQILDLFKLGVVADTWAERELETIGYSADEASLLVIAEAVKLKPTYLTDIGWEVLT